MESENIKEKHQYPFMEQLADMSEEHIKKFRKTFELFDNDGDGIISTDDAEIVLRALGKTPTEHQLKEMIAEYDSAGRGCLDFSDFMVMMVRCENQADDNAELKKAFRVFDKDGNGYISRQELRTVMTYLGEPLTEEEVENFMLEADTDRDGQINYSEFINKMG